MGGARSPSTACDGPAIDTWYGDTQQFGTLGRPQEQISILGRVATANLDALEYSLASGPWTSLPVGPDGARLHHSGDFNVEIPLSRLEDGTNPLELRATGSGGATCSRTVTIEYQSGTTWPLPHSYRFDS
ncbi:MAG: hypothetical protein ACOCUS_04845, partial [Polyangiales bacterium]